MTAKKTAAAPAKDSKDTKKKADPVVEPKKAAPKAAEPAKAAKAPTKAAAKTEAKPAGKAAAKTPAAKGKGDKADSKKAAVVEEEEIDLEAEFAAEAEPESETEGDTGDAADGEKVKAKPLRMKVSRAKERALMREFGLDETALTEEEAAKRRQELKTLIKMGKTRGFLTHQEINDHLPEKLVNEEILEAIISMLNDMGIAVYEQAPDAATLLISGSNTATATEEEAEEAAEAALSTVDSEFGRTTDPVRMYMREMGTV
ncbi:MAG: RNA polymerase sigma factor RpoD, partial [Rubrivivax sp.]|nr:RNA polymerase sigma factor RpoD [Rubrivivax sp.]